MKTNAKEDNYLKTLRVALHLTLFDTGHESDSVHQWIGIQRVSWNSKNSNSEKTSRNKKTDRRGSCYSLAKSDLKSFISVNCPNSEKRRAALTDTSLFEVTELALLVTHTIRKATITYSDNNDLFNNRMFSSKVSEDNITEFNCESRFISNFLREILQTKRL